MLVVRKGSGSDPVDTGGIFYSLVVDLEELESYTNDPVRPMSVWAEF